jgi:hypothetical protein
MVDPRNRDERRLGVPSAVGCRYRLPLSSSREARCDRVSNSLARSGTVLWITEPRGVPACLLPSSIRCTCSSSIRNDTHSAEYDTRATHACGTVRQGPDAHLPVCCGTARPITPSITPLGDDQTPRAGCPSLHFIKLIRRHPPRINRAGSMVIIITVSIWDAWRSVVFWVRLSHRHCSWRAVFSLRLWTAMDPSEGGSLLRFDDGQVGG